MLDRTSIGLILITLFGSCNSIDSQKIVDEFLNTSGEAKSSFLCNDFVFEMVNEAEFPSGEASIKQLLGSFEGYELSDTKSSIYSISKLGDNEVEVVSKKDSWVFECFGSGTSTTREVYYIVNNKICRIAWEEIEKDTVADSISTAIQTDFNNWLDAEDLRNQINDEKGWPIMEKYFEYLKIYCDTKEDPS